MDVDFVCLGSLHELHERYDFYTGVSNTGTFELNNGLVGYAIQLLLAMKCCVLRTYCRPICETLRNERGTSLAVF